jgi:hypothetical protein
MVFSVVHFLLRSMETHPRLTPPLSAHQRQPTQVPTEFFAPLSLIIDITLCGGKSLLYHLSASRLSITADFSGNNATYLQTRSDQCYPDSIVGNGSNYANAYFEIQHIHVFVTSVSLVQVNASNGTSSTLGSGGSSNGTSESGAVGGGKGRWSVGRRSRCCRHSFHCLILIHVRRKFFISV